MTSSKLNPLFTTFILTSLLCLPAVGNVTPITASTCNSLISILPESVHYPNSEAYNESLSSYYFAQGRRFPACIVKPESATDVSSALKILRGSTTPFAVRGGGHNQNKGFSNIDDGVTIDLRAINAVDLSNDGKIVEVGGGALWDKVFGVVESRNLSVVGGRTSTVGVGGFLTGGGVGYVSGEKGFACDWITNLEVVLSNSSIVNANATFNSDLFQALKGGSSNFGIVTRFDLKTFTQGPIRRTLNILTDHGEDELLQAFTDFKDPSRFDPKSHVIIMVGYLARERQFLTMNQMIYTDPSKNSSVFQGLENVGPILNSTTTFARVGEMASSGQLVGAPDLHQHWATATFRISPTILFRIHEQWKIVSQRLSDQYDGRDITVAYTIQSVPSATPDLLPPNSLGFARSSTPEKDWINFLIVLEFREPELEEELENVTYELIRAVEALAEEEGVLERFKYLDYAGRRQDVLESYGEESLEFMKRVARDYDPIGLFQKQMVGGFKLFPSDT